MHTGGVRASGDLHVPLLSTVRHRRPSQHIVVQRAPCENQKHLGDIERHADEFLEAAGGQHLVEDAQRVDRVEADERDEEHHAEHVAVEQRKVCDLWDPRRD